MIRTRDSIALALLLLSLGFVTPGRAERADSLSTRTPPPEKPLPTKPSAKKSRPLVSPAIEGSYRGANGSSTIRIERLSGDFYYLNSTEGWEGIGILQGAEYEGVSRATSGTGPISHQAINWIDPDEPVAQIRQVASTGRPTVQHWHRLGVEAKQVPVAARPDTTSPQIRNDQPKSTDSVYVEVLPEPVTKVPPIYPDLAREAGVEGTVMVQALVLKDGTVGDTKIGKSIPMLDAAAAAAVRQWRFKPAMTKGLPVTVWFPVPVRFSLH